jgi:hypothetical protein
MGAIYGICPIKAVTQITTYQNIPSHPNSLLDRPRQNLIRIRDVKKQTKKKSV